MEIDYVDLLRAEQSNPNGLLMDILTQGYGDWDYVIAVEDHADKLFYFDFVTATLKGLTIHFLLCGGKDAMLKFKEAADAYPWASGLKFRYLCDKDYDDYLNRKLGDVWYTAGYSIESYLVCKDYLRYALAKRCAGGLIQAEINQFCETLFEEFTQTARHFRAFAGYMCELRALALHPDFDQVSVADLAVLVYGKLRPTKKRMDNVMLKLGINEVIPASKLRSRAREFREADPRLWLRGKLALQILRKCYDLALGCLEQRKRQSLPDKSIFSSDALASLIPFLGSLPGLSDYLASGKT